MDFSNILYNACQPPILYFFLGILAKTIKSDLEIPQQIGKFLAIYLLFDIGLKGGQELSISGLTTNALIIMSVCVLLSFISPFLSYLLLRVKLGKADSSAIAASYGSISAVTFATAIAFLESKHLDFDGFMVAGMALMESPAIISGLLIFHYTSTSHQPSSKSKIKPILHDAFFNGSVLLLLGSLFIGYISGPSGKENLKPFVSDIYLGMLCLYMLDMGIISGSKIKELRKAGIYLLVFAIAYPILSSFIGIMLSIALNLNIANALLLTILAGSSSYIAVPAAMRVSIPQANLSLLLPMSLIITFTFNISIGIPLYYHILQNI